MTEPIQTLQNLVDGQWADGRGGEVVSINPADSAVVVATGQGADVAQLDAAVAAAQRVRSAWAHTPAHERGAVLVRAAGIVEANADAWGRELSREEGKPLAEGIGEVARAAQILRFHGNEADREAGEVYSSPRRGERILVTRKPVGVVGVITPFNFPIAIPAWKIAPALTYGNTVVWKPASTVPLPAVRLAEALTEAGLPAGVLNLVLGDREIGTGIIEHPGIDAVTFTGSTGVGRRLAAGGALRGVPVQAELGGKNAAIVLGDADLDLAVEQVALGAFRSTGRKCTATSRLIVTDDVADEVLAALTTRAREIDLPAHDLDIWREELFGPALAVRRVAGVEEAFTPANDGDYGLSAARFTQDLTRTLAAVDHIDVGILHVNSESAGADPHVPFGGAKKSGYGPKEQGRSAREFFTHTTTVYLRGGAARV